ncbi:MAG: phosphatase PAP2 family protein [Spirochaetales bacterium]|nr:phosphatase PAP2 family protein [Spirochaetales bacterium]
MINIIESIENGLGLDIILWFQSWRTPLISNLFSPFNYLGSEIGMLIILPLVYWCVSKTFGRRLFLITLISSWINLWFKDLWMRPRPFMVPGSKVVPAFDYHASYGLPSGHTMLAATTLGYTALSLRKRWVTILTVLLTLLMGVSRMVHGVHFPQDVLVGILLSTVIVLTFGRLEKTMGELFFNVTLPVQIFLAFLMGGLFFFLFWVTKADPKDYENCLSLSSLTAGGVAGIAFEFRYVRFTVRGSFLKKAGRFIVGLTGLFILYLGLRYPSYALMENFPDASLLSGLLRIIRYSSLGLWVVWGAPLLFTKIRLSDRDR